jgi:dihydroorotate dehydrogenase subfamily 2
MKKIIPVLFAVIGILDAGYLTYERFANLIIPCSTGYFVDCGKVLESSYATPFGIPLSIIGVVHYFIFLLIALLTIKYKSGWLKRLLFIITAGGFVASIYFVYLQIFVIGAICIYCMVSAVNSFAAYFILRMLFKNEYRSWLIWLSALGYKLILKNIFFLLSPEVIHERKTKLGEWMGTIGFVKKITAWIYGQTPSVLSQNIAGIDFVSPIGLAAGFDYEARLTQILYTLGFGFQSVGTITNLAYGGNPKPMLGRLPKSRSLMVNKGFKNDGADAVVKKLRKYSFVRPVGISIGQTNGLKNQKIEDVINDISEAFEKFEKSIVRHSYYELNISCPNLSSSVSFYTIANLEKLLKTVDSLKLKRPVFIKMPIEKSDREFLDMLEVIVKHNISGIIVGNLQKNKKDPAFDKKEIKNWPNGGFSGKPTEQRSNELIALSYQKYGKKLIVIGCGGVFNAQDAYTKIKLGASLVQLITGMIYQGPQLIAQINEELPGLLRKDGYKSIKEALGSHHG